MAKILRSALALCTVFCSIWIGTAQLGALQLVPPPGLEQTVQYILSVVNTESGAIRSSPSENTTLSYSMTFAAPCTLALTEVRQTVQSNAAGGSPVAPVREITHYVIPAEDMDFGRFSTHNALERDGTMRVTIFTTRASIRRWYGGGSTMPPEAEVVFNAAINFGKGDVDNFDIPLRLEDALHHLTCLCQAAAKPGSDSCRSH